MEKNNEAFLNNAKKEIAEYDAERKAYEQMSGGKKAEKDPELEELRTVIEQSEKHPINE